MLLKDNLLLASGGGIPPITDLTYRTLVGGETNSNAKELRTFSTLPIGTASDTRVVIACVVWDSHEDTEQPFLLTVEIGGVQARPLGVGETTITGQKNSHHYWCWANVPTGTTVDVDAVFHDSGGRPGYDLYGCIIYTCECDSKKIGLVDLVYGNNALTPLDAVSINTADAGVVLCAISREAGDASTFTNLTEDADVDVNSGDYIACASAETTEGAISISATQSPDWSSAVAISIVGLAEDAANREAITDLTLKTSETSAANIRDETNLFGGTASVAIGTASADRWVAIVLVGLADDASPVNGLCLSFNEAPMYKISSNSPVVAEDPYVSIFVAPAPVGTVGYFVAARDNRLGGPSNISGRLVSLYTFTAINGYLELLDSGSAESLAGSSGDILSDTLTTSPNGIILAAAGTAGGGVKSWTNLTEDADTTSYNLGQTNYYSTASLEPSGTSLAITVNNASSWAAAAALFASIQP